MKSINFINPVPPKKQRALTHWFYGSIIIFIFFAIGIGYFSMHYKQIVTQGLQEIEKLKKYAVAFEAFVAKKQSLVNQKKLLEERLQKIKTLNHSTQNPHDLLKAVAIVTPASICLVSINGEPGNSITIEGLAQDPLSVTKFGEMLNANPQLTDLTLAYLEKTAEKEANIPLFRFKLEGFWELSRPLEQSYGHHE